MTDPVFDSASGTADGLGNGRRLGRRRVWQGIFLALALLPAVSSVWVIAAGTERFVDASQVDPALDNTYRYLGGIYLALAVLAFWSIIEIERRVHSLVFVAAATFVGGVGRLISMVDVGAPSGVAWTVLVIEFGSVVLANLVRLRVTAAGWPPFEPTQPRFSRSAP